LCCIAAVIWRFFFSINTWADKWRIFWMGCEKVWENVLAAIEYMSGSVKDVIVVICGFSELLCSTLQDGGFYTFLSSGVAPGHFSRYLKIHLRRKSSCLPWFLVLMLYCAFLRDGYDQSICKDIIPWKSVFRDIG
jgi:hypothetical protein